MTFQSLQEVQPDIGADDTLPKTPSHRAQFKGMSPRNQRRRQTIYKYNRKQEEEEQKHHKSEGEDEKHPRRPRKLAASAKLSLDLSIQNTLRQFGGRSVSLAVSKSVILRFWRHHLNPQIA